ncbi:hypothetical protein [Deinococcus multiflagellatus]|uniref:Uncharacterized protein n=1 Tax=Deinococcus multiflagellatus TaxID=1656887 RepID=A0ABW1ZLA5_9DEIO|nr:hypothetical protein [Deinococcus multiflagellatus]MBZ9712369.1 hypothetical protein [Deinococcus multiflagellatus]
MYEGGSKIRSVTLYGVTFLAFLGLGLALIVASEVWIPGVPRPSMAFLTLLFVWIPLAGFLALLVLAKRTRFWWPFWLYVFLGMIYLWRWFGTGTWLP